MRFVGFGHRAPRTDGSARHWSARLLFLGAEGYPVEFTGIASAAFSASHEVKDHPRCGRNHGHRWRVAVEITAGQDPETGELVDLPALADAVEGFARELDREFINDMLPGSPPTAAGVALALRERLALRFTKIRSVTVWADDVASTVHA